MKMTTLPKVLRPRERLIREGPGALSDAEVLAVLLGSGYAGRSVLEVSRQILAAQPLRRLAAASHAELVRLRGIGPAKACLLLAAFELARRRLDGREPIASPESVADLVVDIRRSRKEQFVALYLDGRNHLIHREAISTGTLTASLVHPREVFGPAVARSAASIVLAHNHPSGDPQPSDEDIELTHRLVEAGTLLGIAVLDHVIVTEREALSLRRLGVIADEARDG